MAASDWYKGSVHSHTTESDGDESPENVAEWYRRMGYDWLVLSDHNLMTVLGNGSERPLTITGEEITVRRENDPVAVYVNAIGITRVVEPINKGEVLPTLQANVDAVVAAGGIASLTAPYTREGFDLDSLKAIRGAQLMEVFNAHPGHVKGDPIGFSFEGIWDTILTAGVKIYGTASDDSHNYRQFSADNSNPGRAWVMARAAELSEGAIIEALTSGDFYASTGVVLDDVVTSGGSISLNVQEKPVQTYETFFIGRDGSVLASQRGPEAEYRIRGDEGYVRARVASSWGARAWTQPFFIE